jgi:hypothetical protein
MADFFSNFLIVISRYVDKVDFVLATGNAEITEKIEKTTTDENHHDL